MKARLLIASLTSFLLSMIGFPVLANSMTYTAPTSDKPGKFSGELPIARIGALALPDGMVRFIDDEITVEAVPDWLFDREPVLKGDIVRAEVATRNAGSVVAGLVFFTDGTWLPNLGDRRVSDQISTNTDELIVGRIVGRAGQAFVVQPQQGGTRKLNFADIKSIISPRAFAFNILTPTARISPTDTTLTFDSNLITMAASSPQTRFGTRTASVPKSNLAGTDPGIKDRTIGTFVALDVFSEIAPAIAIPLVLNPITQRHALKQISNSLNAQLGLNPTTQSSGNGM